MSSTGLVSIVIPAYKATYFEAALSSALRQNYDEIEIVIGDDCPDEGIAGIVEKLKARSRWPIRYFRNQSGLGEIGNVTRCVTEARGEYIKFLYDDDIIVPDCVRLLVDTLEGTPGVSLVSSRRRLIDTNGEFLPDIPATRFPFEHDTLLNGDDVVSFWGDYTVNFVGEPSSVLCRREDLLAFGDGIFSLDEQEIHWIGDLAIYSKLLRQGNLVMLARPLSYFRISTEQYSQQARDDQAVGVEWHKKFKGLLRQLGWARNSEVNGVVRVAALTDPCEFREHDLLAHFATATVRNSVTGQVQEWFARRVPTDIEMGLIRQRLDVHGGGPSFGILLLDLEGDTQRLMATIRSLGHYQGAAVKTLVFTVAEEPESSPDDPVCFIAIELNGYVTRINEVVRNGDFDWLMMVRAGEEFTPFGLTMVALELLGGADCRAVYGDELQLMSGGNQGAAFRPGFNLDLLLSFPTGMARHWLFRRDVFVDAGGFDPVFSGALEFELILRLIELGGIAGFGHISEPLLITTAPQLVDNQDEQAALQRHLQRRGYVDAQLLSSFPGRYRIRYGHSRQPLISIIVPTRDQLAMLQRCVESLLEKTAYPNYELLIVDNASETPEAKAWLEGVEQMRDERLRVLRYPHPFNYSAINNMAAGEACGEYLVLLNNDTAVISETWLDELLNHAQRPEVGIVGAKLLFPDGRIQHAGVILGLRGPAEHPFIGEAIDAPGYMNRLQVDQNYSAVTAACLMIRKSIYDEVGGLDEEVFKVSYNDIDLCLKVGQLGYLTVWTPHAVLMHEGSVSQKQVDPASVEVKRKRFLAEQDAMYDKWLPQLGHDPAYNGNLALTNEGFALEANVGLTWRPMPWRPLPVVLAHNADPWGCGNYRIIKPFEAMRDEALIDGALSERLLSMPELARLAPDVIVFQRQTKSQALELMAGAKRFSPAFKIYELDDYLPNTPMKSVHRASMSKDLVRLLRQGLSFVDRFVLSTQALADQFKGYHSRIHVVENRLPLDWWGNLVLSVNDGTRPRVGWAGGVGHRGDLEMIADVVRDLAGEVDWVFFGMCPDKLRPYVAEFHPGVDISSYPQFLANLRLDLAIAPLEDNVFNACKSNLRLLEYGICGFPVIASDIVSYRGSLPVTLVKNRYRDWVEAIRGALAERNALRVEGQRLQAAIKREWMLSGDNLKLWQRAWLPD